MGIPDKGISMSKDPVLGMNMTWLGSWEICVVGIQERGASGGHWTGLTGKRPVSGLRILVLILTSVEATEGRKHGRPPCGTVRTGCPVGSRWRGRSDECGKNSGVLFALASWETVLMTGSRQTAMLRRALFQRYLGKNQDLLMDWIWEMREKKESSYKTQFKYHPFR